MEVEALYNVCSRAHKEGIMESRMQENMHDSLCLYMQFFLQIHVQRTMSVLHASFGNDLGLLARYYILNSQRYHFSRASLRPST